MLQSIKQWFTLPVFESDEEKTRRAKLTNAVNITIFVFSIFIFVGNIIGGRIPLPTLIVNLSILVACFFAHLALRRGRVTAAGIIITVSSMLVVTASVITLGTVRAPAAAIYLLVVIVSGLLFEKRGIFFSSATSSLAVLGLIVAENMGLLPTPDRHVNVTQWITYTALFVFTGGLTSFAIGATNRALFRVEKELAERNLAEAALRDSQSLLQALADSTLQSFILMDRDGKILFYNRMAAESAKSVLGIDLRVGEVGMKYMVNPNAPGFGQLFMKALSGEAVTVENHTCTPDHREVWMSFTLTPIQAKDGSVSGVCLNISDITERKLVEIELRKLTLAVEQSPASIVITDLKGNIEYVNPRFTQVTGYGFEEAIGANPRILRTNQTPPETYRQLWETLARGEEWRGEFVNRKKDGSLYYESAVISPIINEQGAATHYLAVKEDITERRKSEIALRESEARFRSLFEQNHDGVFIVDLNERVVDANQRAADMLGYRLEELRNIQRQDLFATNDQSENSLRRLLAGESIPLIERTFRKKDGQIFPVEISAELIHDQEGSPKYVQAIARDISKRKRAETELRENRKFLADLIENSAALIFVKDLEGRYELINRRFEEAVNLSRFQIIGHTDTEIFPADVAAQFYEYDARVMELGEAIEIEDAVDNTNSGKQFFTIKFPLLADNGSVRGVCGITMDITERKQAEEKLQQEIAERKRMEDALFNQNQFLAVLHQTTLQLLKSRDVTSLLNIIVTQAAEFVGASYGIIFLSEGDDMVLGAAVSNFELHVGDREKKPGAGVLGQVWQSMRPVVINDYREWEGHDPSYLKWNLRAMAGVPIIGREGPLGVLEVARTEEDMRSFTGQEVEMFVQFAALASLVLDNAQLYAKAQDEISERKKAEEALAQAKALVELEREKADALLLNILPQEIAARLKENDDLLIADRFEQASILFADVVNFTPLSATLAPEELVELLDEIFSHFDLLTEQHGLEKVKTIGDCYMAVAGVPRPMPDHARAIVLLALEFQSYVASRAFQGQNIQIRIGINSGPVVAGVIGSKKFAYDIWGDTVNTASRMEAHGVAGTVQITESTYDHIKDQFVCEPRGSVYVKGKGEMPVWHVISKR